MSALRLAARNRQALDRGSRELLKQYRRCDPRLRDALIHVTKITVDFFEKQAKKPHNIGKPVITLGGDDREGA